MDVRGACVAQAQTACEARVLGLRPEPLRRIAVCHTGYRPGIGAGESRGRAHAGELSSAARCSAYAPRCRHTIRYAHAGGTGLLREQHQHDQRTASPLPVRDAQPDGGAVARAFLTCVITAVALGALDGTARADDRLWI